MKREYLDSTPPQAARVVGGWTLAVGLTMFFITFREFGVAHPPRGAITSTVILIIGALFLVLGSIRLAAVDRTNRAFFRAHAGTEILASRRRLQSRLESARLRLLLVVLFFAACWVVFAGGYSCESGVCTGFVSHQERLMDFFMWSFAILGLITLMVATLARVHGNETDRWEDLASDYLRRNDGPVPGSKRSRWD